MRTTTRIVTTGPRAVCAVAEITSAITGANTTISTDLVIETLGDAVINPRSRRFAERVTITSVGRGYIQVVRGVAGTRARPHAAGTEIELWPELYHDPSEGQ